MPRTPTASGPLRWKGVTELQCFLVYRQRVQHGRKAGNYSPGVKAHVAVYGALHNWQKSCLNMTTYRRAATQLPIGSCF